MIERYKEDLKKYLMQVEEKRGMERDKDYPDESMHLDFYIEHSKEELNEFINNYINKNEIKNDYQFYYFLKSLTKYMVGKYDGHTGVTFPSLTNLPYSIKCIEDSYYIEESIYNEFNYGKILSINNVSIDKIKFELANIICYQTENWRQFYTSYFLNKLEVLKSLPSLSIDNELILETTKGLLKIDLNNIPEFKAKTKENYKVEIIDNCLLFTYNACLFLNDDKDSMKKKVIEIDNIMKGKDINNFIIDLRGNNGGKDYVFNPLLEYLSKNNYKIVALVDKGSYSATGFAIRQLKEIGALIIGEDVGVVFNEFGNVKKGNNLPNTNFGVKFSKDYFISMTNIIHTKKGLEKLDKSLLVPNTIEIDKYVDYTFEDFISGKDTYLEEAINILNKEKELKI